MIKVILKAYDKLWTNFLCHTSVFLWVTIWGIQHLQNFLSADNLAANFSRELADYIIYIIDVSGGDKIPRKGGPGITQADLLVCSFILLIAW